MNRQFSDIFHKATTHEPFAYQARLAGRCNRRGDPAGGKIFWIEPDNAAPYTQEQLDEARKRLAELAGAGASL